ncbi:MAG: flagellar biosynthesis protein FlhA [Alphaproteobacteria bacterium]
MADTARPQAAAASPLLDRLNGLLRHGDVVLALGVVFILVVLIMPMPRWLLDVMLAGSLTFSVLILLVSLFISRPLEFSSFPTVLLVATLLRLSLNLASTRLILAHGHEGTQAAGQVIQAFGNFVMQGNFVIGVVVFSILVIVNFIVITKGAGRIAEVSARFSLDAMPGKQMAIDADMSAGLIDENEARARRKSLEEESSFFGAMDGAAKFVRGDAIAGILITLVNIVGGIVIGVAQTGLSFADAAKSYSVLTVGDGLITQIPALIVSTAAGMLVSKAGVDGPANRALFGQLSGFPKAFVLTGSLLVVLAILPGIPMLPFLILAAAAGFAGWLGLKNKQRAAAAAAAPVEAPAPPAEEPIAAALHIDQIRLELGYSLLGLLDTQKGHRLTDQIKALRKQLAGEFGFVMPSVRIQDNMQLPGNTYLVRVKEVEAGRGELRPQMLLVMDPRGEPLALPGEETTEPTFGLPAMWVAPQHREEASFRGYTVVEPATVITTHLTEVVKDNMADLLSFSETQKLLDDLGREHQKLVADLVPGRVPVGIVQRVLQGLLAERVSVRDLATILEGIGEAAGFTQNVTLMIEHVRARLARQLCDLAADAQSVVPLVSLSADWEQAFADAIVGKGDERQLAMAPSRLQQFIGQVRQAFERQAMLGHTPVLLTSPAIRPFVRSIVERFRPATMVMSQAEIHPRAKVRTLATV